MIPKCARFRSPKTLKLRSGDGETNVVFLYDVQGLRREMGPPWPTSRAGTRPGKSPRPPRAAPSLARAPQGLAIDQICACFPSVKRLSKNAKPVPGSRCLTGRQGGLPRPPRAARAAFAGFRGCRRDRARGRARRGPAGQRALAAPTVSSRAPPAPAGRSACQPWRTRQKRAGPRSA